MNWWDDDVRLNLIAYAAVAGPALVVFVAFRPRPLLPMQRLRFGSWNGASVLFHFILWSTAIYSAQLLFDRLGLLERLIPPFAAPADAAVDPDPQKAADRIKTLRELRFWNLCVPLGSVLFLAMSFTLLPILQRSQVSNAGITRSRWWANVRLGLVAFVLATPPIFAIEFVCTRIFGLEKHPFEVLGSSHGLEFAEWAAILINTSLLGPICEEWLFRGLLQGWLRHRATYLEHAIFVCIVALLVGFQVTSRKVAGLSVPVGLVALTAMLAAVDLGGFYTLYRRLHQFGLAAFRRSDLPPLPEEENAIDAWTANLFEAEGHEHLTRPWRDFGPRWFPWKIACARWSIVGSAMFFALAHGAWPTPIALFFLGLVLGWLAFRTQSLVAPIVVHGLFNLLSYLVLVIMSMRG